MKAMTLDYVSRNHSKIIDRTPQKLKAGKPRSEEGRDVHYDENPIDMRNGRRPVLVSNRDQRGFTVVSGIN